MYSIYKNMSRSVIIHFFIQRILIFRVRRDGYFHWFSSTIIQERPECFLKRLFSVFLFSLQFVCLFLIIIPQSTTQGSRPEKVKVFLAFLNQFLTLFFLDEIDNKPCSSERAETRVSDEMFPLFFGEFSLFFRFFCFVCVL